MSIDTVDEVTQVLTTAREAAGRAQWPLAFGMLSELHESAAATDENWTEIRFLLGEACWALDDLPAARRFYEESSVGAGEHAAQGSARLAELDRLGAAEAESGDGVVATELIDVVNAAGEALMRQDFDTAVGLYERAYAVPDVDIATMSVIINGFGDCHLGMHHYDEAREWYSWLLESGDSTFAQAATDGIAEIDRLAAARDMAADGTKVVELRPVFEAANEAYVNGDYDTAIALFESVLANPVLSPKQKANSLFNLGQCHVHRGERDQAKARFTEAADFAAGDVAEWVAERLEMLEREDEALQTAGLIAVD